MTPRVARRVTSINARVCGRCNASPRPGTPSANAVRGGHQHAGAESDLETRIDEQPLPADTGIADSTGAIRAMLDRGHAQTSLVIQSSSPVAGTFIQTPSVIVISGAADWDHDAVRSALATAAGRLWT